MDEKILIKIDSEIADLIPGFLANRRCDVESIRKALTEGDFETIRILGHKMKGNGAGYGFEAISTIGRSLEQSAREKSPNAIRHWTDELAGYLEKIEVVYG